jgi:protein O-GlcNAc transferase
MTGSKLQSALQLLDAGEVLQAERICKEVLAGSPGDIDALYCLGVINRRLRRFDEARKCLQKVVRLRPDSPRAYYTLANILKDEGQLDEAILMFQKVTALDPGNAYAFNNLGIAFREKGDIEEAVAYYRKALKLNPDLAYTHYNLGSALSAMGQLDEAITSFKRALELKLDGPSIYFDLGVALQENGRPDESVTYLRKAVELKPDFPEALNNLGAALQTQNQFAEAITCYQKAVRLAPNFAEAYNNLGNVLKQQGRLEEATANYGRAIGARPDYVTALYNLGDSLGHQGKLEEATAAFDKVLGLKPDLVAARWARCMWQLPIIYPDEPSILSSRGRYSDELKKLEETISLTTPQEIKSAADAVGSHQPFLLACQGLNDRDLQEQYGKLVCRIMAARYPEFAVPPSPSHRTSGGPFRIGFVSAYFHYHSIWKIPLRGWIEDLNREKFVIYGYHIGPKKDGITESAKKSCNRFREDVHVVEDLCKLVRSDDLHALIFPDIGMDPLTAKIAALRLAPVQCTSLGHPETTGLPTIDYYLSSDLMEPSEADGHYTERLVRLPNLGFSYIPPDIPYKETGRAGFGIPDESVLYLCSHALFTYLPQYDSVFPLIAREVGGCKFLFIGYRGEKSRGTELFRMRIEKAFAKLGLDAGKYLVFSPTLSPPDYQAVNRMSDVFLDSIGWSANNSTFEALACDLPVVTLPGSLMRQRHCSAILSMMGLTETIAANPDEYVEIAVRLGQDTEWRRHISEKISASKHLLYNDRESISAFEDFIEKAVNSKNYL